MRRLSTAFAKTVSARPATMKRSVIGTTTCQSASMNRVVSSDCIFRGLVSYSLRAFIVLTIFAGSTRAAIPNAAKTALGQALKQYYNKTISGELIRLSVSDAGGWTPGRGHDLGGVTMPRASGREEHEADDRRRANLKAISSRQRTVIRLITPNATGCEKRPGPFSR